MRDGHIWCPRCSTVGMLPSGIVCPRCKGKQTIPAPAAPAEGEPRTTKNFAEVVEARMKADPRLAVAIEREIEIAKLEQQVYDLTARLAELEEIAEEMRYTVEQFVAHSNPECSDLDRMDCNDADFVLDKYAAWKEKAK